MSDTKQEMTRSEFKAMREQARLDSLEQIRNYIEYAYDWETILRRIERHAATFSRTYSGIEDVGDCISIASLLEAAGAAKSNERTSE